MMRDRMLSAADVAALLGCSRHTVYRRWERWGLTSYRIGRSLKFSERELERWLRTRREAT